MHPSTGEQVIGFLGEQVDRVMANKVHPAAQHPLADNSTKCVWAMIVTNYIYNMFETCTLSLFNNLFILDWWNAEQKDRKTHRWHTVYSDTMSCNPPITNLIALVSPTAWLKEKVKTYTANLGKTLRWGPRWWWWMVDGGWVDGWVDGWEAWMTSEDGCRSSSTYRLRRVLRWDEQVQGPIVVLLPTEGA